VADNEEPDGRRESTEDPVPFKKEDTREYNLDQVGKASAARSEIGFDRPEAAEDTKQVVLPDARRRKVSVAQAAAESAQWPEREQSGGWLRRAFAKDPLVRWYFSRSRAVRTRLFLAFWVIITAGAVVGIFVWSSLGIFPWLEHYLRPAFAPRPAEPVRVVPRDDALFDLVEDRSVPMNRFIMGEDHVWLTRAPGSKVEIDADKMDLLYKGEAVASLDLRKNWDGLIRVYFRVGDIMPNTPFTIRLPIIGGGMWSVGSGAGYRVFRIGGPIPAYVDVGPVVFSQR
jgi:hypothetical protein